MYVKEGKMAGTEGKMTKPVITVKDLYKVYRIGENRVRALTAASSVRL